MCAANETARGEIYKLLVDKRGGNEYNIENAGFVPVPQQDRGSAS